MNEAAPTPLEGQLVIAEAGVDLDATAAQLERRVQRGNVSAALSDRLITVLSPIILLALWELLARSGLLDVRFFPPPSSIAGTFWQMARTGTLWLHAAATLERVGIGLAIGCVTGVALGLIMGLAHWVRAAMLPILAVTMPIPKIALLPLLMLILGLGDASKVAIVALSVFFIMVYNTMVGVVSIPRIYLEVGRSFKASPGNFYRTVAIPGAMPMILTGFKLSFAVGLLGYIGGILLEELEHKLVPWRL